VPSRLADLIRKARRLAAERDRLIEAMAAEWTLALRGQPLSPADLDERRFGELLYTGGQPDPDLLIRTSGEMRVSNFLLWQIAYAEIYVTDTLWPDFRRRHLFEAVLAYQKRERRYGGISPGVREPVARRSAHSARREFAEGRSR